MSRTGASLMIAEVARLTSEVARLREALKRNRKGFQNILDLRQINGTFGFGVFEDQVRYGALTRDEIEGVIAEIDAALAGAPAPPVEDAQFDKPGETGAMGKSNRRIVPEPTVYGRSPVPTILGE